MLKSIEVPALGVAKLAPPGGSLRTKTMSVGSEATGMKFGTSFAMTLVTGINQTMEVTDDPSGP